MLPKALRRVSRPMTLIAGLKCNEGFSLLADSQETVTIEGVDYRVTRQKLVPIQAGQVQVAIAGAGDGDLIDAFVERFKRTLSGSQIRELDSFRELFKNEIFAFAKEQHIRIGKIHDKLRFLAAAYAPDEQFAVWRTAAGEPIEVQDKALVGFNDRRYEYALDNLYRPGIPMSQGVFLGLYLMWLGEQTSNSIKAPITVATLTRAGIRFEDQNKVNRIDQKVRLFTAQFERQFLACSDTGLQNSEFADSFKDFGRTIVQFRSDFIREWAERAIENGLDRMVEAWNEAPAGTMIVPVPLTSPVEQSLREMHERGAAQLRQTVPHLQEKSRVLSNLTVLRRFLEAGRDGATVNDQNFGEVLNEVSQAAMMGPVHLNQMEHLMLARVLEVMMGSPEEMRNHKLHLATVALRIAVIDQALAVLEAATPLGSQT